MTTEVQKAALLIADAALRAIEGDPHSWSTRPCQTCLIVGQVLGRRFGCYRFADVVATGVSRWEAPKVMAENPVSPERES